MCSNVKFEKVQEKFIKCPNYLLINGPLHNYSPIMIHLRLDIFVNN